MTSNETAALRRETRDIFYHGYDNYMSFAFPEDELRPVSCTPLTRDRANPAHIEVNDVLGNYSLTLIDSLSTLAIMASSPEEDEAREGKNRALEDFQDGIAALVTLYGDGSVGQAGQGTRARGFDLDSKVQVFETCIRGLGGLLSTHLFAVGDLPIRGYEALLQEVDGRPGIVWRYGFVYDGQLLRLAHDLGERLLPAFHTPTGLPYPRVNLRHGIPFYDHSPLNNDAEHGQCQRDPRESREITETCSAGAGSLILEFTTLNRLTGDGRFEQLAKKAFWAVWERRSASGLVGAGIDAETGHWVTPYTGIGAGIGSFFEYAFKSHVLLSGLPYDPHKYATDSPDAFLSVWQSAHSAIKHHVYRGPQYQHPHYIQVDVYTGALRAFWIDSLSAYYPGLLTSAGELDEAIETHLTHTALWTRYNALPERWSTATGNIESGLRWWGGRPEFIESTWYLHRATQDPWYLHVGEMVLRDIKRRCYTDCGWAGLQDVQTGELSDRMESFFLGETAKYLFLLFDPTHPLNTMDGPVVFTTEGHPLVIPKRLRRSNAPSTPRPSTTTAFEAQSSPAPQPTCPASGLDVPFSVSATANRSDIFHAAALTRLHLAPKTPVDLTFSFPGMSHSDYESPTNHAFYPWTLPAGLVPYNGMSSMMAARTTFDLSFPTLPDVVLNAGALIRVEGGIVVKSLSGLRLGMLRESEAHFLYDQATGNMYPSGGGVFRVYTVGNIVLGRDEKIYLGREALAGFHPVDPHFTRVRDAETVDLVLDIPAIPSDSDEETLASVGNGSALQQSPESDVSSADLLVAVSEDAESDSAQDPSVLGTFFDQLHSMFNDLASSSSSSETDVSHSKPKPQPFTRHVIPAALPLGPGAVPLPSSANEDSDHTTSPLGQLPYRTIQVVPGDGTLCTRRLSKKIAQSHQIVVVKRGGCAFSDKLANIPSLAPERTGLQLVVVVDMDSDSAAEGAGDHVGLVRPRLDVVQKTPAGLERRHGIAMVLAGGGQRTWELFRKAAGVKAGTEEELGGEEGKARGEDGDGKEEGAKAREPGTRGGVGVQRRFWFQSQGLRIANLVALP
ncbi:hypothetical protein B0A49_02729 [Cryomyces minteri]|uniref:alpha-1,2-Mannosidase n=1 Tax=Cryomyces minteri TaxID=331657 RepID=A0A4U0XKH6_9PEZI|nr:hypothetical protein B0A49_02729 [Cryomyces minteri]